MGYRPKRSVFKLSFSGTEYEGLEITARAVPMSLMLDIAAAVATQDPSATRHVATTFAYSLESWNLVDDDDQPVPADADGLLSQEAPLVSAVIKAWVTVMAGSS